MRKIVYIAMLAAGLAAVSYAQPGPMPGMGPEPGMIPDGDEQVCPPWDKERKMLEAVRITRMTEALELNDKQIAEFFPRLKQMDDGIREVTRARSKLVKELDSLLDRGSKEAELRAKLSQIDNLEIERLNKMKNFKLEMDRILTVKQQAKMVVFNHNFDEEIREMVREIRQKRMKHFRN